MLRIKHANMPGSTEILTLVLIGCALLAAAMWRCPMSKWRVPVLKRDAVAPDLKLRLDPVETGSRPAVNYSEDTLIFSRVPQHGPADQYNNNVGIAKFVSRMY